MTKNSKMHIGKIFQILILTYSTQYKKFEKNDENIEAQKLF